MAHRKGNPGANAAPATDAAAIERQMKREHRKLIRQMEAGLATCEVGTQSHLKTLSAISDERRKFRDELVRRGLSPQSLGLVKRGSWRFIARIGSDGAVTTIEAESERQFQQLCSEETAKYKARTRRTPKEKAIIAELDAEFGFVSDAEGSTE
jgi:hypothetical protein